MTRVVEYYFALVSPWSYFGHDRFVAICAKHGAAVNLKPVDLSRVFPVSGGLPLAKRAPQRQAYRLVELARWRDRLGMPINAQPKFAASGGDLGAKWILAARERGVAGAMRLAGGLMRARWAEERDIADPATLAAVAAAEGLDAGTLAARAASPEIAAQADMSTQQAIDAQVFGVPWYVVDGESFWGQDRLDFVDLKLAQ